MDANAPFELDVLIPTEKSVTTDEGDVIIEGYAADFEVDRQGEAFLPGAFDDACEKATRAEIPLLFEHDNKRQLGVIEELRVDPERGLWTRARIAKAQAGTWAEDVVDKVRRGMMKGLSVRGLSRVTITKNGPRIGTIDLAEISVTPVPVQPGALFAVAQKSFEAAAEDIAAGEIEEVSDETAEALNYFAEKVADLHAAYDRLEVASKAMHEEDEYEVDEGMLAALLDRVGMVAQAGDAEMLAELFASIEWQSEWDESVDDMTYKGREDLPALLRAVVEVARAAGGKPSAEDLRPVLPSKKSMGDFTDQPWSGSSAGYDDAQWKRACVLDRGPDAGEGKQRYGLPVREPDGTLNCRAVANARARISQVKGASAEAVARAQRKLDTFAKQCENYRSKSLTGCSQCDCADCANCDCIDCECVNCKPRQTEKSETWQRKEGQNPKGGLNSKGRASLKAQGQNIRPGVKNYSKASVADKKRWISWALRFYTNPSGPMIGKNGEPTRLALTAAAWGEPVPKTRAAAQAIAAKARRRKAELERQGAYK
jgi:HK97 family phage prohead protease